MSPSSRLRPLRRGPDAVVFAALALALIAPSGVAHAEERLLWVPGPSCGQVLTSKNRDALACVENTAEFEVKVQYVRPAAQGGEESVTIVLGAGRAGGVPLTPGARIEVTTAGQEGSTSRQPLRAGAVFRVVLDDRRLRIDCYENCSS